MENLKSLWQQIQTFQPFDEQEAIDKSTMLSAIDHFDDVLLRENNLCHFAASCWVTNHPHDKILMAFHNIYQTWAWTGGHADGDADLLHVAEKELQEETGITKFKPLSSNIFSLEVIPVDSHIKHNKLIPPHLHLDCCFLFEADESEITRAKPDENSSVRWFSLEDAVRMRKEPIMQSIYQKLNQKLLHFDQNHSR